MRSRYFRILFDQRRGLVFFRQNLELENRGPAWSVKLDSISIDNLGRAIPVQYGKSRPVMTDFDAKQWVLDLDRTSLADYLYSRQRLSVRFVGVKRGEVDIVSGSRSERYPILSK